MKGSILLLIFLGCQTHSADVYVDILSPDSFLELKSDGTFLHARDGKELHGDYTRDAEVIVLKFANGDAVSMEIGSDSLLATSDAVWRKCKPVKSGAEYRQFYRERILPKVELVKKRNAIEDDINNIAVSAYQYRIRPASMGGGAGSFRGYRLPSGLSWSPFAEYSVIVRQDSIVVNAIIPEPQGSVRCVISSVGRPRDWQWSGGVASLEIGAWW